MPFAIRRAACAILLAVVVTALPSAAPAETRLLRFPAIHGDRVVFTYGGDLWMAPASGGTATRLTAHPGLELFTRFSPDGRWIAFTGQYDGDGQVYVMPATGGVTSVALSPKGERALFSARGDIFTAPVEKGPTRNLTATSGAHDKRARWSPDGARIAFISDLSGEDELYVVAQDGSRPPERLTTGGRAMRYAPAWSADGRRIAFGDKDGKVFVHSFDDRTLREIVDAPRGQVRDYTWSPRGHHLVTMTGLNGFGSVHVWSEQEGRSAAPPTSSSTPRARPGIPTAGISSS